MHCALQETDTLTENKAFSIQREGKTKRHKDEKWCLAVTLHFLLTAVFCSVENTNNPSLTYTHSPTIKLPSKKSVIHCWNISYHYFLKVYDRICFNHLEEICLGSYCMYGYFNDSFSQWKSALKPINCVCLFSKQRQIIRVTYSHGSRRFFFKRKIRIELGRVFLPPLKFKPWVIPCLFLSTEILSITPMQLMQSVIFTLDTFWVSCYKSTWQACTRHFSSHDCGSFKIRAVGWELSDNNPLLSGDHMLTDS